MTPCPAFNEKIISVYYQINFFQHAKMLCLTVPLMEKNPVQVFTSRGPERIANCSVTTVEVWSI